MPPVRVAASTRRSTSTAPRSEPGSCTSSSRPGVIRVLVNGKLRAQPFLDIRSQVRAAASRGCSRSPSTRLRDEPPLLRRLHRHERRRARRRVPLERRRAGRATRGQLLLRRHQPYANHNGGQLAVRPGRDALRRAPATAARAATRSNRAQNLRLAARQAPAPERRQARRALADRRLRPAQPVALLVRPRHRRPLHRRRRPGRLGGGRLRHAAQQSRPEQLRLARSTRARRATTGRSSSNPRGALVFPIVVYPHSQGCSITGGYVYRGRRAGGRRPLLLRRLLQRHDLEPALVERQAADVRREPFKVSGLSSFGEDAAGELYAISLDGTSTSSRASRVRRRRRPAGPAGRAPRRRAPAATRSASAARARGRGSPRCESSRWFRRCSSSRSPSSRSSTASSCRSSSAFPSATRSIVRTALSRR